VLVPGRPANTEPPFELLAGEIVGCLRKALDNIEWQVSACLRESSYCRGQHRTSGRRTGVQVWLESPLV
jgi:hypothetical protein